MLNGREPPEDTGGQPRDRQRASSSTKHHTTHRHSKSPFLINKRQGCTHASLTNPADHARGPPRIPRLQTAIETGLACRSNLTRPALSSIREVRPRRTTPRGFATSCGWLPACIMSPCQFILPPILLAGCPRLLELPRMGRTEPCPSS